MRLSVQTIIYLLTSHLVAAQSTHWMFGNKTKSDFASYWEVFNINTDRMKILENVWVGMWIDTNIWVGDAEVRGSGSGKGLMYFRGDFLKKC